MVPEGLTGPWGSLSTRREPENATVPVLLAGNKNDKQEICRSTAMYCDKEDLGRGARGGRMGVRTCFVGCSSRRAGMASVSGCLAIWMRQAPIPV